MAGDKPISLLIGMPICTNLRTELENHEEVKLILEHYDIPVPVRLLNKIADAKVTLESRERMLKAEYDRIIGGKWPGT